MLKNPKPVSSHKLQATFKTMSTSIRLTAVAASLQLVLVGAHAQTPPSAGQVLQQQQQQAPQPPRESQGLSITAPAAAVTLPGGAQVVLKSVVFEGNTVLSAEVLQQLVAPSLGVSLDLAGLRGVAERVSERYRSSGYPFARAFLPPQDLQDGVLRIQVLEGQYGQVQALSDKAALAQQAQAWLAPLASGSVIESSALERATLLLDDLPGIRTAPVIKPGQAMGTGDLDVRVTRSEPFDGSVGIDNHGNRYTGYHRVRANANINSPFVLGDQISIQGLVSDQDLWLGSLAYSAPLGASGLRGTLSYAHTDYEIGKELSDSNAKGTAKVKSAGLSYPWVRSQKTNLNLQATLQQKRFKDEVGGQINKKRSDVVPIALQFDRRDTFGGGGITFGSVSWTNGRLKLAAGAEDDLNTRGTFNKLNLDVVRLQALAPSWSLYGRLSAQQADKNLDSSETLSIAGPAAVRAYPVGEQQASGDEGWLTQLEVRYSMGELAPYAFYDHGRVRVNAKSASPNRELAGYGAGLRYQRGAWSADMALAWRSKGGAPKDANERDSKPRVWVSAAYRF
jgi:hemolysin activation/secretion protein